MPTATKSRRRNRGANYDADVGQGVDIYGGRAFDPSENVKALNEAANKRQDDLRAANNALYDAQIECLGEIVDLRGMHARELGNLRAEHSKERDGWAREMRIAEAARIDSIRQVDVQAGRIEASRALEAIQTLAATTARDAETLRNALVSTATTIAAQTAGTFASYAERIAALEKSSYEGMGKQRVADPQLAELVQQVKNLSESRAGSTGKGLGVAMVGAIAVGAVIIITGAIGLIAFVSKNGAPPTTPSAQPQVIYIQPSPAGASTTQTESTTTPKR